MRAAYLKLKQFNPLSTITASRVTHIATGTGLIVTGIGLAQRAAAAPDTYEATPAHSPRQPACLDPQTALQPTNTALPPVKPTKDVAQLLQQLQQQIESHTFQHDISTYKIFSRTLGDLLDCARNAKAGSQAQLYAKILVLAESAALKLVQKNDLRSRLYVSYPLSEILQLFDFVSRGAGCPSNGTRPGWPLEAKQHLLATLEKLEEAPDWTVTDCFFSRYSVGKRPVDPWKSRLYAGQIRRNLAYALEIDAERLAADVPVVSIF